MSNAIQASIDIHASNDKDFLVKLREIDITVPPRGVGRDQRDHVEPYVICCLVATLAKSSSLTFPLTLKQREKPDFLLCMQGKACVGVEVSEVTPNGYAHCVATANKMNRSSVLMESGHFRDDKIHTREELQSLIDQDCLTAPLSYGNQPEQEWARFMASSIKIKLEKLVKHEKFDENWLVLYDNLLLPSVDRYTAINMLIASLPNLWMVKPAFHAIFIESGKFIFKIAPGGWERLAINDIWS